MRGQSKEERIASLDRRVDALSIAVQALIAGVEPGVLRNSRISNEWIEAITEKYGKEGCIAVLYQLEQLGFSVRKL